LIEEIKNAPQERAEELVKSLHSENNSEHWSQVRKVLNYYYSLLIKDEIFVSVVNTAIKKKDFEIVNSYLKSIYSELNPSSALDLTIAKKYIGVLYYDFESQKFNFTEKDLSQKMNSISIFTEQKTFLENDDNILFEKNNEWATTFISKDIEALTNLYINRIKLIQEDLISDIFEGFLSDPPKYESLLFSINYLTNSNFKFSSYVIPKEYRISKFIGLEFEKFKSNKSKYHYSTIYPEYNLDNDVSSVELLDFLKNILRYSNTIQDESLSDFLNTLFNVIFLNLNINEIKLFLEKNNISLNNKDNLTTIKNKVTEFLKTNKIKSYKATNIAANIFVAL
jgi:hypothetical protein